MGIMKEICTILVNFSSFLVIEMHYLVLCGDWAGNQLTLHIHNHR